MKIIIPILNNEKGAIQDSGINILDATKKIQTRIDKEKWWWKTPDAYIFIEKYNFGRKCYMNASGSLGLQMKIWRICYMQQSDSIWSQTNMNFQVLKHLLEKTYEE